MALRGQLYYKVDINSLSVKTTQNKVWITNFDCETISFLAGIVLKQSIYNFSTFERKTDHEKNCKSLYEAEI